MKRRSPSSRRFISAKLAKMPKSRKKSFSKTSKNTSEKLNGQGSAPAGTTKGGCSELSLCHHGWRNKNSERAGFRRNGKTGKNQLQCKRPRPCSAQPETQDAGFCISPKQLIHGSNATMAPSLEGHHGRREVTIHSSPTRTPGLQTEGLTFHAWPGGNLRWGL